MSRLFIVLTTFFWSYAGYSQSLILEKEVIFEDQLEEVVLGENGEPLYLTFSNPLGMEPYSYGYIEHREYGIIFLEGRQRVLLRKNESILCANSTTLITRYYGYKNGKNSINQYTIQGKKLVLANKIDLPHEEFVVSRLSFSEGPILVYETSEGDGGGGEMTFYSNILEKVYSYRPFEEGFEYYSADYNQGQLMIIAKSRNTDATKFSSYDLEKKEIIADTTFASQTRIRFAELIKKDTILLSLALPTRKGKTILLDKSFRTIWEQESEVAAFDAALNEEYLFLQIKRSIYCLAFQSGNVQGSINLLDKIPEAKKVSSLRNVAPRIRMHNLTNDKLGLTVEVVNEPEKIWLYSCLSFLDNTLVVSLTRKLDNQLVKMLKAQPDNKILLVTDRKLLQFSR